jgi:hypothetical protein
MGHLGGLKTTKHHFGVFIAGFEDYTEICSKGVSVITRKQK